MADELHHAGMNRMTRSFFLACWIVSSLTFLASQSTATTATKSVFAPSDGIYLNPNTGRFWSIDSYEGNDQDPLSLHKYLYCQNDPINGVDPSGHEFDIPTLDVTMSEGEDVEASSAVASMAAKRMALSKIQQVGLNIAATLLVMQEIGFGPGDIVDSIQTQTTQRANPTESAYAYQNFECDAFANDAKIYFLKEGKQPQIICYYAPPATIKKDEIRAVAGLFSGLAISESGKHEGVLVDGEVFDNNLPFGVPRTLWESGYVVSPNAMAFGNFINLRQANDLNYGVITPP